MTVKDVEHAIAKIDSCKGDDEAAHSYEDDLHMDVLRAIADGEAESPVEMAALALTTKDIDFARWCA